MWRDRIVAAALLRDNVARDEAVRERLDDMRPLQLAARASILVNLAAVAAAAVLWAFPLRLLLLMIALMAVHEWHIALVRAAREGRHLERRLLVSALLLVAWAAAAMVALGGAHPLGLLPLGLIVAGFSLVLSVRPLMILLGVSVAIVAGGLLLDGSRMDPVGAEAVSTQWGFVLAGALTFLGLAPLTFLNTRHLRRARGAAQQALAELRVVQRELSESHRQLERGNEELAAAIGRQTTELEERNRHLAMIHVVSSELSAAMDDEGSLARALGVLAEQSGVTAAATYVAAVDGEAPVWTAVARPDAGIPIPERMLVEVTERGTPWTSDELVPAVVTPGDPLPPRLAVVPLVAHGRAVGALAVAGGEPRPWADAELGVLAVVAREVVAAVEHRRLYHAAVAEAAREALLNEVAGVLGSVAPGLDALGQAIRRAGRALGAAEAVLVGHTERSRHPRVLARAQLDGGLARPPSGGDSADPFEAMLVAAPALVEDRMHPLVLGLGGEMPLSAAVAELGVSSMLVAPVTSPRANSGALVLAGAGGKRWTRDDIEFVERLAGTFAGRLQSDALFHLQERRISELAGLAQIAEIVQSTVDTDRLFSGFARALQQLLPFSDLYVARLDADGALLPVVRYDAEGRVRHVTRAQPHEALHEWFALHTVTLWSAEQGTPPAFYVGAGQPAVVVPLRPKGQVLGAVVVTPAAPPAADQAALVGQAVGQLALALDSLSLYRQATERAARIQVLGNLARIVASVVDLRDAFDVFAEEVRWLIPFERAVIMRVDQEHGLIQPYVACPGDDDLLAASAPLASSLAFAAYESQHVVPLSRDDPWAVGRDWSLFGDATEVAMVPIVRDDICTAVFALAHADGERYTAEEIAAMEEIGRLLAVSIERVELFQQAEHSARHDLLTGLPNYRYLQERIAHVRRGFAEPGTTAVLMVDMDDLKLFNDTLGHAVGDQVVQIVGRTMRAVCRADDFVARVGGDEFVIVMEGVDVAGGVAVAERVHEALREAHLAVTGAPTAIRVSAGVAAAPQDADAMDDLLHAADAAMYEAKFAGGGRTAVAGPRPQTRVTHAFRGRSDRLVETLVRASTAGATVREREAVAMAQRYAVAAALRLGMPAHESEVLKMLVARQSGMRLADIRPSLDQTLAFLVLDGLAAEWASRAPESAAVGQIVVTAAVDLAWLQLSAPSGAGCTLEEAIARLGAGRQRALDTAVLRELEAVARIDAEERERREAA